MRCWCLYAVRQTFSYLLCSLMDPNHDELNAMVDHVAAGIGLRYGLHKNWHVSAFRKANLGYDNRKASGV